jgi:dipeptidyl aminopeptidase/acylaminoacyl peptidase
MPSDRYSPFYTMRITTLADDGTHAHRDLIPEWGDIYLSTWSHDGSSVVFIGKPKGSKIGSKADLFVVGSAGGTPVNRTPKLVNGVGGGLQPDFPSAGLFATPISILPDGSVIVDAQDGGMVHLYRIALDGAEKWSEIVTGERTCYLQDVRGGKILFGACDLINPPDLYVANDNGTDERRLTALNADYLANIMQPTVEHLLFRSKDDALVEGWMLKPATGSAPYPTVLYIHGGPHSGFGHAYGFDFQMLAGAGFGVLLVNHRGSTGYGDEFANAILGDWGNLDYADLMAGVDFAIAQGLTDADRLGICGLSGGGNLSTWSIGQTRRFKAAVPENPVTNWVSFYGVSDIGVWFATNELGGHPHEIPDVYHRCSPISYAHTCTTPTLLVQCEHDWRCPPEQSEQYYTVLKANGCTVEMLRVPNEPHAGCVYGGVKARRSQNDALLGWMKQYV